MLKVTNPLAVKWSSRIPNLGALGSTRTVFPRRNYNKVDGAAQMYKATMNRGIKHMLNYILGKVDEMNLEFLSEYFRLSTLYSTITDEYRSILVCL